MKGKVLAGIAAVFGTLCIGVASAMATPLPVDVDFALSGAPGNYEVNFTITNSSPTSVRLYYFGILLPMGGVTGTLEPGFANLGSYNPSSQAGVPSAPNINYTYVLGDNLGPTLSSGSSLHFQVFDYASSFPGAISWFVQALGTPGDPHWGSNPDSYYYDSSFGPAGWGAFAASTTANSVPEPATMLLLAAGLACLTGTRSRMKAH